MQFLDEYTVRSFATTMRMYLATAITTFKFTLHFVKHGLKCVVMVKDNICLISINLITVVDFTSFCELSM